MSCSVLWALLVVALWLSFASLEGNDHAAADEAPGHGAQAPPAGFRRLRPQVLGFAIEHEEAADRFRLIEDGAPPEAPPICEGELEACEARLIEVLQERHGRGQVNLPFRTLGGKQFWADRSVCCGWRVQENVLTGHCRLLDAKDLRRCWGSFEACRTALEAARVRDNLKPRSPRLVVLLHGLGRARSSFAAMKARLEAEGYEVADLNYPSTRRELRDHAEQIAGVLGDFDGVREVSFVTHSLGGIVVRELLSLERPWRQRLALGRVVMIAPPNQGSALAEVFENWLPARWIWGKPLPQLTPEEVAKVPPMPSGCEFGIIAGGKLSRRGLNPLLEGDDDGVVTVESTRLAGAKDFLLLRASHTFIMSAEPTIEAVVSFLAAGAFR